MSETKYNISFGLIQYSCENNLLDTLYYFHKLQHAFNNRVIFDPTIRKISQITGASIGTCHKHIKIMLKYRWIEYQKNGEILKLRGVNNLANEYGQLIIQIPKKQTKQEQILEFRNAILRNNLNKQIYTINKKCSIVNKVKTPKAKISKNEVQFIKKHGGTERLESTINNRLTLSNHKIGKLLNRSANSGKRYQKQLNLANLIQSSKFYQIIGKLGKNLREIKKYFLLGFIELANGYAVRRLSNTITLPLY